MRTEELLLIALGVAFILTEVCRKLKIPRAVGQMAAGIVLGITLHAWFSPHNMDDFSFFADVGAVLMFFFVGLEINVKDIRHYVQTGMLIAIFNTFIPLVASIVIMPLLGFDFITSAIIGICLAVSSQAAGVDFLEEMGLLHSRIGKLIVTAAAVDDFVEFILIAVVLSFIHSAIEQQSLTDILIGFVIYLALVLVFRYVVIPIFLKVLEDEKSESNMLLGSVVILFLVAVAGDIFGIGGLLGAFTAGVLIRHTLLTGKNRRPWEELKIAHMIRTISFGLFVPVFFIWTGFNVNIGDVLANPAFTILAIVIAFVGTVGGTTIGTMLGGRKPLEGFVVGWGVNAKGDTEVAIASAALNAGAITIAVYSGLIVMSIFATFVSPLAFQYLIRHHHACLVR